MAVDMFASFNTLLICLFFVVRSDAGVIETDSSQEYLFQEIHCNPSSDCTIICNHDQSCAGATIYCPTTYDCHAICNSTSACASATIVWSLDKTITSTLTCERLTSCVKTTRPPIFAPDDDNPFYLDCTPEECYGAVVECPLNAECHITCQNDFSCLNAQFIFPLTSPYTLTCESAPSSCKDIVYSPYDNTQDLVLTADQQEMFAMSTINCPTDASCTIHCDAWGACGYSSDYEDAYYLSRSHTTINCPISGAYSCDITCQGQYACRDALITGYGTLSICDGEKVCETTRFPEPPSNTEYSLECTGLNACRSSKIQCPANADCHISCNSQDSCRDSMIVWPSTTATNSTLFCHSSFLDICEHVNALYTVDQYALTQDTEFNVVCDDATTCSGHIIHCPLNAGCFVSCSAEYACNGLLVHWIEDQPHGLQCGDYIGSCRGTLIIPGVFDNNQNFVLDCAEDMCAFSTIQCPTNASCTILCRSERSCYAAVIKGGMDHPLTVHCADSAAEYKACDKAMIYAQDTSLFHLNGCGLSCRQISVWFPSAKDGSARAILDVQPEMVEDLNEISFYAINGWMDIQIDVDYSMWSDTRPPHYYGKMHCSADYSVICHLLRNFTCNPYGVSICNGSDVITTTVVTETTTTTTSQAPSEETIDDGVSVVNITLVAITENDNTTQLIKYIEDSTMNILTAHYDYTPLDTDVLITNTGVDDGEDTSVFTYTFSVTITLNSTTTIDQIEIETDLTEGFDEYNLNINIEVYVVSDDATSPRTSSQSDDTDLDDILNYIQRRFEDLTTLELIIGISGIVVICCCIPLCICCLCRQCKNRRRIGDSSDTDQVKKPELRDDNTLTPPGVRDHDSSIELPNLPEDRHVNARGNDKDKKEGRKLDLHAQDSDGMYARDVEPTPRKRVKRRVKGKKVKRRAKGSTAYL